MSSTTRSNTAPPFDGVFEQAKDAGERTLAALRKAGNVYLDSYEKTVDRASEAQLKFAGLTQQEWLTSLIEAQVDATRELTKSYTTAARAALK
jgi:hypothetical protein